MHNKQIFIEVEGRKIIFNRSQSHRHPRLTRRTCSHWVQQSPTGVFAIPLTCQLKDKREKSDMPSSWKDIEWFLSKTRASLLVSCQWSGSPWNRFLAIHVFWEDDMLIFLLRSVNLAVPIRLCLHPGCCSFFVSHRRLLLAQQQWLYQGSVKRNQCPS